MIGFITFTAELNLELSAKQEWNETLAHFSDLNLNVLTLLG